MTADDQSLSGNPASTTSVPAPALQADHALAVSGGPGDQPPAELPASAGADAQRRRQLLHTHALSGAAYAQALRGGATTPPGNPLSRELADTAMLHAADVRLGAADGDVLVGMLADHMLLTHARILHLTQLAMKQKTLADMQIAHEACDRASNTYRRQLLALRQCQRVAQPAAPAATAVQQTFVAGQQIVNNHVTLPGQEIVSNELGFVPAQPGITPAQPASLPAPLIDPADGHEAPVPIPVPAPATRAKRRYRLTEAGRRALQAAARRTQPWRQATGPRSDAGKLRSSVNALKHGQRRRTVRELEQRGATLVASVSERTLDRPRTKPRAAP